MGSQSSSVGYTIMGKTADLTVVQKTTIDTLQKEGKTQKVIAKEAGCSQSSVSKQINRAAKGRKRCGRKQCTSNRDNRTLESIVKQSPFKNVGEIHKEWTAAEWSKVMFSDESQFCISFGNQGPRVWMKRGEAQNPRCLKSSVKFPQSVMVWGAMSSAGVGPLCFLRSRVNAAIYQEVLEHFLLLTNFMEMQISFSNRTWHLHTVPKLPVPGLRTMVSLFLIGQQTRLTLAPWGIVKRKMRYARLNNAEELKATIRATWALITPEQCHRLIDSMPRCIAAVIQAKGAPTKY